MRKTTAAPQRADQRMQNHTALGIGYFLGQTEESTANMADAILEKRHQLHSPEVAQSAALLAETRAAIDAALAHGSCLMALPCHVEALLLLRALAHDASLRLVLVDSPAARTLSDEAFAGRHIERCATQDLVKRVKRADVEDVQAVYISFPELHSLTHGTTATILFLGKACRVSVLESLLCVSGLNTLLTLGSRDDASHPHLMVVSWNRSVFAQNQTRAISVALGWLWSHLQAVASVAPAEMLSWHALYRASEHCRHIERENQIKQLEAYFEAWRRSPAALSADTHQLALARLAAMRDHKPPGAAA
ncbi:MAG: hypothetical protein HYZ65_00105 [Burkholderiales bacterium]|nr:hypothetical protein [Burkholderiales bacterium]